MQKNYQEYRNLSSKQKQRRISSAQISQKNRKPDPLGEEIFPQIGFIDYNVNQKGKNIRLETYRYASTETKAIIFLFHGLNAHIGQGAHVAKYLSEKGFDVVGFDHRGFGRSQGQPGFIHNLETHLDDSKGFIDKYLENLNKQSKKIKIPKFALGISMGGMTVYYLTLRYPNLFNGVILMAPALMHNLPSFVPPFTNFISNILPESTRLLRPFTDRSNKNPTVADNRRKDQYCFSDRASLSTMNMIVTVMQKSYETFEQFNSPFLLIQGGLDKLVNPVGAFELYDKSKTEQIDKKLLFYQHMWHGIWQQDQIWQILSQCDKWLNHRLQRQENYLIIKPTL